jgi:adenine/guanine phosphoribosyltransferase-like PRPP-binding protein
MFLRKIRLYFIMSTIILDLLSSQTFPQVANHPSSIFEQINNETGSMEEKLKKTLGEIATSTTESNLHDSSLAPIAQTFKQLLDQSDKLKKCLGRYECQRRFGNELENLPNNFFSYEEEKDFLTLDQFERSEKKIEICSSRISSPLSSDASERYLTSSLDHLSNCMLEENHQVIRELHSFAKDLSAANNQVKRFPDKEKQNLKKSLLVKVKQQMAASYLDWSIKLGQEEINDPVAVILKDFYQWPVTPANRRKILADPAYEKFLPLLETVFKDGTVFPQDKDERQNYRKIFIDQTIESIADLTIKNQAFEDADRRLPQIRGQLERYFNETISQNRSLTAAEISALEEINNRSFATDGNLRLATLNNNACIKSHADNNLLAPRMSNPICEFEQLRQQLLKPQLQDHPTRDQFPEGDEYADIMVGNFEQLTIQRSQALADKFVLGHFVKNNPLVIGAGAHDYGHGYKAKTYRDMILEGKVSFNSNKPEELNDFLSSYFNSHQKLAQKIIEWEKSSDPDEAIKNILYSNPHLAADLIAEDPSRVSLICSYALTAVNEINQDKEQDEMWGQIYGWGMIVAGATLAIASFGAGTPLAWGMLAAGGFSLGVGGTIYDNHQYHQTKDNLLSQLASQSLSQKNGQNLGFTDQELQQAIEDVMAKQTMKNWALALLPLEAFAVGDFVLAVRTMRFSRTAGAELIRRSGLNATERFSEIQLGLKREGLSPIVQLSGQTPDQLAKAIEEAHLLGGVRPAEGFSPSVLRQKVQLLKEAGLTKEQREWVIKNFYAGTIRRTHHGEMALGDLQRPTVLVHKKYGLIHWDPNGVKYEDNVLTFNYRKLNSDKVEVGFAKIEDLAFLNSSLANKFSLERARSVFGFADTQVSFHFAAQTLSRRLKNLGEQSHLFQQYQKYYNSIGGEGSLKDALNRWAQSLNSTGKLTKDEQIRFRQLVVAIRENLGEDIVRSGVLEQMANVSQSAETLTLSPLKNEGSFFLGKPISDIPVDITYSIVHNSINSGDELIEASQRADSVGRRIRTFGVNNQESTNYLARALHVLKDDPLWRNAEQVLDQIEGPLSRSIPLEKIDLIIPAPSTTLGHRASDLLAEVLAKRLNKKFTANGFIRETRDKQQTLPDSIQRFYNIAGSFLADDDILRGRTILIMDDVVDSGATVDEMVRLAYEAGAKEVYVAGILRSARHGP